MDLAERSHASFARHPWEVVRAQFFQQVAERFCDLDLNSCCLDVGAGDAWFAQQFVEFAPEIHRFVCWDINYEPQQISEVRDRAPESLELTRARPEGRFDLLLLLDVLEHVPDDRAFLQSLVGESLADDGTVIISVPAYQALFSSHDRFLHHYRRYSPAQCRSLIADAGLRPLAQGGLFHTLLPVRAAQVMRERARPRGDRYTSAVGHWNGGRAFTKAVTSVLSMDAAASLYLGARQRVVPGLSYWAVARQA